MATTVGFTATLKAQFAHSQSIALRLHAARIFPQQCRRRRWALLPSAAGFVDPLLSTGFPLALLGFADGGNHPKRLGHAAVRNEPASLCLKNRKRNTRGSPFDRGSVFHHGQISVFASLSMLYFAAASFSESARGLGKAHLAPSFLLHDETRFGPATRSCLEQAQSVARPLKFANSTNKLRRPSNLSISQACATSTATIGIP